MKSPNFISLKTSKNIDINNKISIFEVPFNECIELKNYSPIIKNNIDLINSFSSSKNSNEIQQKKSLPSFEKKINLKAKNKIYSRIPGKIPG